MEHPSAETIKHEKDHLEASPLGRHEEAKKQNDCDKENAKDSDSRNHSNNHNTTTSVTVSTCPFAIPLATKHQQQQQQSPLLLPSSTESSPSFSYTSVPPSSSSTTSHSITAAQALQLAKEACPAFQSSCPFRNIQDEQSMRAALQKLPPSHLSFRSSHEIKKDNRPNYGKNEDGIQNKHEKQENGVKENEIGELVKVALAHVHTVSRRHLDVTDMDGNGPFVAEPHAPFLIQRQQQQQKQQQQQQQQKYGKSASFSDEMERLSLFGLMGKLIEEELGIEPQTMEKDEKEVKHDTTEIVDSVQDTAVTSTPSSTTRTVQTMSKPIKRIGSATLLSQALKQGTKESHSAAESVHFVKEFIKGNIDRTLYSILICNLYYLYKELEQWLDQYAPEYFPTLHFPKELKRTQALKDDVDFFHGDEKLWGGGGGGENGNEYGRTRPSKATLEYIARLEYIAQHEPLLLLSHAYTRYLGDLSGGKILARVAKRAMNLQPDDSGLKFYQFDEIPSAKLFKDKYRKALDELVLTEEQIERLVAEANVAFVLNMRIFEELDVLNEIEGAVVRDYECATVYYDECIKRQRLRKDGVVMGNGIETAGRNDHGMEPRKEGQQAKCPFAMLGGSNPHQESSKKVGKNNALDQTTTIQQSNFSMDSSTSTNQGEKVKERCPWPFIFFHDPRTGMKDYQTWIVIGLFLCYFWNVVQHRLDLVP